MRVTVREVPRWPTWPGWAVAIVVVWLGGVWLVDHLAPGTQLCHLKRHTGVPCPTCGLTRGVTAVVERGDLAGGVAYNPLWMVAGGILAGLLAVRVLFRRAPRVELTGRERRLAVVALAALVLLNWAYVIVYVG